MDHLPRPRASPDFAHSFQIPFLHNPRFDYNNACLSHLEGHNLASAAGTDLGSFIQSWYFFGLIKEIFEQISGIAVDFTDFLRVSDKNNLIIDTRKLPTIISIWHAREAKCPERERLERFQSVRRRLFETDLVLKTYLTSSDKLAPDANLDDCASENYPSIPATMLLVKVLGFTLCDALITVYGTFAPIDGAKSEPLFELDLPKTEAVMELENFHFFSSFEDDPIIRRLLERAGWCQFQVEECDRLYASQGHLGLRYYLTFLDMRNIPGDHTKCTKTKCVGYQVVEDDYVTKHFMGLDDCDCQFISLSNNYEIDLTLDIIQKEGIPLLRIENNIVRIFRLGLDGEPPPFVAISHVWAEGMGNTKENALPWCVIRILQYSAEQSCPGLENVHFWIDTLCIPVKHERERKKAIKRMPELYARAEKVVVLDRTLMTAYCGTYREEVLIRIAVSPWASRLWTLQEGRLSRSLSFFFADKFYETNHIVADTSKYFSAALFVDPEVALWKEWYEKKKDQYSLQLISSHAMLGVDEAVQCLNSMKQNTQSQESPSTAIKHFEQATGDASRPLDTVPSTSMFYPAELRTISDKESISSIISRIGAYHKRAFIRMHANNAFGSFGSCPPSHPQTPTISPVMRYDTIAASMRRRDLTHREDEAICLGTLMGFDLDPILHASSCDERIRIFLCSFSRLPFNILLHEKEKLQQYGQRWIPKSLLRSSYKKFESECEVREDGRLQYRGCGILSQFPFVIPSAGELCFTIHLDDGKEFFVGISPQHGLDISPSEKRYVILPSKPPAPKLQLPQRVVVLSLYGKQNDSLQSGNAMVETRYEFTGWIFEKVGPADMALQGNKYDIWQDSNKHVWEYIEADCMRAAFSVTGENQEWIIG